MAPELLFEEWVAGEGQPQHVEGSSSASSGTLCCAIHVKQGWQGMRLKRCEAEEVGDGQVSEGFKCQGQEFGLCPEGKKGSFVLFHCLFFFLS